MRAPLLGMELTPPAGFRVAVATPNRMELVSSKSVWRLSLFTVECGTSQVKGLAGKLAGALGKGGKVNELPGKLAGRPARWLRFAGLRQGQKWSGCALWSAHGGQAWVIEALGPAGSGWAAEGALRKLAASWKWLQPERG